MYLVAKPFSGNTGLSNTEAQLAVTPDARYYHVFSGLFVPEGYVFRPMSISLSTNYNVIDNGIPSGLSDCEVAEELRGSHIQYSRRGVLPVWNYYIEHIAEAYHCIGSGFAIGTPCCHVPASDCRHLIIRPGEQLAGRSHQTMPSWAWLCLYWRGFLYPDTPEVILRLQGMDN